MKIVFNKPLKPLIKILKNSKQRVHNQVFSNVNTLKQKTNIHDSYQSLKTKTKSFTASTITKIKLQYNETKEIFHNMLSIGKFFGKHTKKAILEGSKTAYNEAIETCNNTSVFLRDVYKTAQLKSKRFLNRNYAKFIGNETNKGQKSPSLIQKAEKLAFWGMNKGLKKVGEGIVTLPKRIDNTVDNLLMSLIHFIFPTKVKPSVYRPSIATTMETQNTRTVNFLNPTTKITTRLIKHKDGSFEKEICKGEDCRIRSQLKHDKTTGKAVLVQTFYNFSDKPVTLKKETTLPNSKMEGFPLLNYMLNLISREEIQRSAIA